MLTKADLDYLVKFSHITSDTSAPQDVLTHLAATVVSEHTADAVAVFLVDDVADLKLVASQGIPAPACELALDATMIGTDLAKTLLAAFPNVFAYARTFPFINNGQLFGALVALFKNPTELSDSKVAFIQMLVHLSAGALHRGSQYNKLKCAYDELKKSQEAFTRTEKLRALGQMAAVIAHDLMNLLTPLSLGTQRLEKMADQPEKVRQINDRFRQCVNRGIATVERLRKFSKQSPDQSVAQDVNLNVLLNEAIEITRPRLAAIELILELGSPPEVRVASTEFVSAVVNLVLNAMDAMGVCGTIFIRSGKSNEGGWIEVEDTGPGIPPEIKSRLMEPFFTTKGEKGTGLGLASVAAFAQRHNGTLMIDSEPGKGAKFTLWFPGSRQV